MAPWRKDQVRKLVVAVHKGQRERKPLVRVFQEFAPDNRRHWTACQKKWHFLPDAEKCLTNEEEEELVAPEAQGKGSRVSIQWTNITGPSDYGGGSEEFKECKIPTATENKEGQENENESDEEEEENDGEENENKRAMSENRFPLRRAEW